MPPLHRGGGGGEGGGGEKKKRHPLSPASASHLSGVALLPRWADKKTDRQAALLSPPFPFSSLTLTTAIDYWSEFQHIFYQFFLNISMVLFVIFFFLSIAGCLFQNGLCQVGKEWCYDGKRIFPEFLPAI